LRKLLLHLDTSRHASVFDRIVAFDGGADEVMSYGGVTEDVVRDFAHGAIFTRGPRDLHNTAIFIGGTDVTAGERLLAAVQKAFFGPMRVSVMLDPNGSNTTAAAAVAKLQQGAGSLRDRRVLITAGTGPVGVRAAGLLARAGAEVTITSRSEAGQAAAAAISARFGGTVRAVTPASALQMAAALDEAELLLNTGPAGVQLVPRTAWTGRSDLRVIADANAVPPLGIEGVESRDDGVERDGLRAFGALAIGGLKMKIHKACIARLFERNDLVLDAETIVEIAEGILAST
jgi:methylenetetrahydrofolate/methylenetetrahydromethanopterin dehydrogenase (NADP+)